MAEYFEKETVSGVLIKITDTVLAIRVLKSGVTQ